MNDIAQQFAIGAVTIAATRDVAVRAEVLKVGDTVRILHKPDYGSPRVDTGVIVAFEPFKDQPTIVICYIKSEYNKVEMAMLYFNDASKGVEVLPATEGLDLSVERSRVHEWFESERTKARARLAEIDQHQAYFERYFGSVLQEAKAAIEHQPA